MSTITKETAAEKRERLLNQPITVSELSLKDKVALRKELDDEVNGIYLKSGKTKTKAEDGEKKVAPEYMLTFQPAVRAKIDALNLPTGGHWTQKFAGYLWNSKGYKADPSKLEDNDKFIYLHNRYAEKDPIPEAKPKAKKVVAKKVVMPDSEDDEPKTTGGAKRKATANDSEDEEEVKQEVKQEVKPKAVPKPPTKQAPKPKADDGLKLPPKEQGLVQTYKGKEVYTGQVEGVIHVWTNADNEAGDYLGIYNPKTKEVEEAAEEEDEE